MADGGVRVVIVDDVAEMRGLLRELLRLRGCDVVGEADHGQDALELLASTRADVVVIDHQMPVMDGLEATARIRTAWPHVRIAAFTGEGDPAVVEAMLSAGADAHFHKGDFDRLLTYVAAAPRAGP